MSFQIITIILFTIVAVGALCVLIGVVVYEKRNKEKTLIEQNKNDWLFYGFQKKIFTLCYPTPKSEKICGIDVAEYNRYCRLLHITNDFKNLVALRIESIVILLSCLGFAYIVSYNILASAAFILCGMIFLYFMYVTPYDKIKKAADEKLFHITDDLPRFLSLFEKAMDLPVDQAMLVTASKFKSPLSDDIIDSFNKVSLGGKGWQDTLIDLAHTYDIVIFSDLVLEIVNAYEQGVNIRSIINRKAYEVEQDRLYAVEAHDAKIKTLIFIPIMALKIVPLMVLICMPMITEFLM